MKVSFLIPFRDVDGTRTPAKEWILARWRHFYPDAEFVIEPDDGQDPFCKSMAVNRAAAKATGDVLVILDADTWVSTEAMQEGFNLLRGGVCAWFIPARRSLRLTESFSRWLLSMDPTGDLPRIVNNRQVVEQAGGVVGFCHIVPRAAFEAVGGMDERFRGWGGEDSCFVRSLDVVVGRHRVASRYPLISLWHARPRAFRGRVWEGQTEAHGALRRELGRRYMSVGYSRERMLALLGEPGGPLVQAVAA